MFQIPLRTYWRRQIQYLTSYLLVKFANRPFAAMRKQGKLGSKPPQPPSRPAQRITQRSLLRCKPTNAPWRLDYDALAVCHDLSDASVPKPPFDIRPFRHCLPRVVDGRDDVDDQSWLVWPSPDRRDGGRISPDLDAGAFPGSPMPP